uniref:WD repeat-containing protein 43-like n=1 Tax=Oncorhynchus gorbuscha TaxID=8017 RepID=UPI001EAF7546|nr:WD repeat-containing protein 43-like [Oncorhynchus gorbuscha]
MFFCCPPVCYGVPYLQDPVYLKCPSSPLLLCRPCKKPLSPSCTVQMSGLEDIPVPVPLLAAALTADTRSLLLAYGSYLQPVMERLDVNTAERHVCLTRNVHTTLTIAMETTVSKVKTPVVNAKSKVIVPGLPGHQAPVKATLGSEKRKKGTDTKEMSIEERLGEIDLSREKGGVKETPSLQTDNFAVLLVQGLESKDANILNNVFQTRKDNLIKKTVSRLPIPAVLPLVEELTKRMQGHPYTAVLMVRWLKAVLMQHTSYLSSLPDLVSQLGVLYHMIESRVKMFHKLTKLHGKLYLLMTQVVTGDSGVTDVDHKAKLVYEDGSSDEDKASGDEGLPDEDSDNWEEDGIEDETMEDEHREEETEEGMRTESKANGDSDMEPGNESEEE